jgi:regulator of sigma E protease
MNEFLNGFGATIFVLGLVIFVHELGHFLAAKWAGVYAPRFSIGFGPSLLSRKWGETEYILAAIPLGGYVRMASREDETMALLEGGPETAGEPDTVGGSGAQVVPDETVRPARARYWDPNALAPFGPKPVPTNRLFESKPLAKRLVIMFAGVTMNLVLGFVILTGLAWHGGEARINTRVVGEVPATPPVLRQHLTSGDTILSVDGKAVTTWNEIIQGIAAGEGSPLVLGTNRGEQRIDVGGRGAPSRETIALAIQNQFRQPAVLGELRAGDAADRAGLQQGDSVLAVDAHPVSTWDELVSRIRPAPGRPLAFTIVRQGQLDTIVATPDSVRDINPETGQTETIGRLGVSAPAAERIPVSFGRAVRAGALLTVGMAGTVVDILRKLFTQEVSLSQLSGPIGIARASAQAAEVGFDRLLQLVALLSINLAVFNLLPIPILDGGQILLNVAESIKGSALSARTREYALRVGLLAIAMLLVLVMFNDIKSWLGL